MLELGRRVLCCRPPPIEANSISDAVSSCQAQRRERNLIETRGVNTLARAQRRRRERIGAGAVRPCARGMSVTLHTSSGDLKIEIYCDTVPRTAFNFLALAASGYYDGTIFHRNIKGFMLQGGDPTGTGKGGESVWGGKFADEIHPDNLHSQRGIVSMANKGPGTNGSQFFITYAKHPHLDNNYAVFGKMIDGWDALNAIERVECNEKHRPLKEVRIDSVTIHANPIADQQIIYPSATGPPDIQS